MKENCRITKNQQNKLKMTENSVNKNLPKIKKHNETRRPNQNALASKSNK